MDASESLGTTRVPNAVAGVKRKASSSSPGSPPKRPLTETNLHHPPQSVRPPIHNCPVCHRPCWFCQASDSSLGEQDPLSQREYPQETMSSHKSSTTARSEVSMKTDVSKTSSGKRKCDDGQTYIGAKDPAFAAKILVPCKVRVRHTLTTKFGPEKIFGEQIQGAPAGARLAFDKAELEKVAIEITQYERRGDDENALVMTCARRLLVHEYLQDPEGPVTTISLRKDKWKPHKPGPNIRRADYFYDWDVEPDVTYTVSINQFDLEYRDMLKTPPMDRWLAEMEASCPYLTIEYKSSAKTGKRLHAVHQNTAASVIWLYQRRSMRRELKLYTTDLRHYSVVLIDGHFEIWEARCEEEGFIMQILAKGNLTVVDDLETYVKWSNSIHAWGLGPNAASFKSDALKLLEWLGENPPSTSALPPSTPQLSTAAAAMPSTSSSTSEGHRGETSASLPPLPTAAASEQE